MKTRIAPAWWFLAPYLAITAVFFCWPLIDSLILAFHQTNGPRSQIFVGFANFAYVLADRDFHVAVVNTVVFALCSLLVQLPLSLLLAILLHESRSRWVGFARLVLFSPQLTGQIFVGIIFAALFLPRYGLINLALQATIGWGLDKAWLQDPSLVMPALVISSLWMYVGFNMIYFLAGLQSVDQSLVEAARIDGANRWQVFRHVTLPALKPVTIFVILTSTIGSFQLFELPFALLQGPGPANSGLTIVGYLYQAAFNSGDLGTGAAVGWLLSFLIFLVGLVQIQVSGTLKKDG